MIPPETELRQFMRAFLEDKLPPETPAEKDAAAVMLHEALTKRFPDFNLPDVATLRFLLDMADEGSNVN